MLTACHTCVTRRVKTLARPAGLEPATPGLEGCVPVTEVLTCQWVARTATRMCHAIDLPRVAANAPNTASAHADW